jgi:hypothetical protein
MSDTEQLLKIIAEQLQGKLYHVIVSDRTHEHKKYVIEYAEKTKSN